MVSSSRSPSSLTKKMKATQFSPIQQKIFKKASSSSNARRQDTVFRKASQLSILCDVQVCVIWFESDGDLKIWPEEREVVKSMAKKYIELSEEQRRKGSVTLHEVLEEIKNNKNQKKLGDLLPKVSFPVSDNVRSRFGNYSGDEIKELIQSLEHTRTEFLHKIQNKKKNMGNHPEPTMNHHLHLQQQSNHVPFFNYNHGDGDITQIPQVSASDFILGQILDPSLQLMNYPLLDVGNSCITQFPQVSASDLNQEQSLAPLPPELMMYPNSDVGNYLGSLGVQGTEINGFQNMNTGSFGVQGYGSYGFQNMNMLSYNNNIHVNDSSSLY